MRRSSSEMTNEENAVQPITSLRMNSNSVDALSQILVDEELAKLSNNNSIEPTTVPNNENHSIPLGSCSTSTISKHPKRPPLPNESQSLTSKMETFENLPDQAVILERLVRIREYKQQVLDTLDKLKNNGEEIDRSLLSKLIKAYDSFKEQEEQYLQILQKVFALKQQFTLRLAAHSSSQSELSDISDQTPLPSFSADLAAEIVHNPQNLRPSNILSKSLQNRQVNLSQMIPNHNRQRRSSDFELSAYHRDAVQVGSHRPPQSNLSSKSRELEVLKEKLETLKTLCDATSDELIRKPHDAEGQRAVKNKLLILNENRKRVDELLNCIDNVDEVISNTDELFSSYSSAVAFDNGILRQSNKFNSALIKPASSSAFDMPAPNPRTLVKSSSPSVESKRNQKTQHDNASFKSDNEQNSVAYQQKYNELTATKNRLTKLQHLVGQLQDNVDSTNVSKPTNPQTTLVKNTDSYVENGEDSENEIANMAALSFRMRSAYESKLNEQQQAVQNLQEEHERLMTIKNQLMTLSNAQVHPSNVSQSGSKSFERSTREDVSAGCGNEEGYRESRPSHSVQQQKPNSALQPRFRTTSTGQQMNNLKEIGLGNSPIITRLKPRINENLPTGQKDDAGNDDIRYSSTSASTIVNNPRLPSFRRNNQLDENNVSHSETIPRRHGRSVKRDEAPLPSTPRRMSLDSCSQYDNRRRDSSHDHYANANLEQQYEQLQQHIDSIRSIFQQLMKEHSVGPSTNVHQQTPPQNFIQQQQQQQQINSMNSNSSQQPLIDAAAKLLVQQQNPWDHLYSSLNPSSLAVQQQQLMVSLFSCQQQLQLQQMEMRYLQQLCQDLLSTRHATAALAAENNAADNFQSTRSRSASLVHSTAPPPHPPGAINLPLLDGRPLSTASLYNLLAPNPYLTFPYYPAQQQFQQQSYQSTNEQQMQQAQQKFSSGSYRNSTVQPYSSVNVKYQKHNQNRHAPTMSQSLIEHGSERFFSDGETNTNANLMSMSDTLKSTTAKAGDFENHSMYNSNNKSNASKNQKNFDSQYDTRQQPYFNNFAPDGSLTGDQFDTLREMIYSEVATLISQNEQRPHFLLELFRELQLLTSEHLRTRALQAIRNVLNRYLFNEGHMQEPDHNHGHQVVASHNVVEETQTESTGTSDDENLKQTRRFREPSGLAKLQENIFSPSEDVTVDEIILISDSRKDTEGAKPPKRVDSTEKSKNLKDSVEKVAQSSSQNTKKPETIPPDVSSITVSSENAKVVPDKSNVDVGGLEQQIQSVVDELIPFLKDNVDSVCNPQLLQHLRKMVISLAISKCLPAGSANTFFQRQLSSILDDTLAKFQGQNLQDCGEEMLGDVSEVVFNELAFFRLMQNIDSVDNEPRKSDADESEDNLGPETTEPEDDEEEESDKPSSPEVMAAVSHPDISELSEDISAVTAISTSRFATKMDVAPAESKSTLSNAVTSNDNEKNRRQSGDSGKAVEVVLTAPLTVQITSATDDDENSLSTSESTSMHTADIHPYVEVVQKADLVKQTSSDSKESTPPDELLLDIEEVPENIDIADQTPTIPAEREITTFDLDFEPHPEDKLQLTIDSVEFRNLQNELMVPDEVEEEDDEQQTSSLETGANLNSFSDNTQTCTGD